MNYDPKEVLSTILSDAEERAPKLDDLTILGGIDYEEPIPPPDVGSTDFSVRCLQISSRLNQYPHALSYDCSTPIVKCQEVFDIISALHNEVASTGTVSAPPRGRWEHMGDPVLDTCAAILEKASEPLGDSVTVSGRGSLPNTPGSFTITPVRNTTFSSPTRYTVVEPIAAYTGEFLDDPLMLPSLSVPSVLTDIGFNTLTIPTPLLSGELYVAHHYLLDQLFDRLGVFAFDDAMAACPSSSCGVGFPSGIHQDDLKLSAAQCSSLVGRNVPNAINAIPKYVPAGDTRTRVVCGVNCLVTGAMKSLTKPAQEAIVRLTQSQNPGVSAVGLAKNNTAVNGYFSRRLGDFDLTANTTIFSADHTKCDRTVGPHYLGSAYAYLSHYSGNEVNMDTIKWMLRSSVLAPMIYRGIRVDGRLCEASGDACTCHTNTIFNVYVHVAVFMRTVISCESYCPALRRAVYLCYHGDFSQFNLIFDALTKDMVFVMFSDDGLVFTKEKFTSVWNPKNWSKRLQSISGLRVDVRKSHSAKLSEGVEFLGCHLRWNPGSYKDRVYGPLTLAPKSSRLAKQLTLVKQGSLYQTIERLGGVLLSSSCMLFTEPGMFQSFYDVTHEWVVDQCERLNVSVPDIFPDMDLVESVAFGDAPLCLQEQSDRVCVCGASVFTVCQECPTPLPLCITHAIQHHSTTDHPFSGGVCSCGEKRLDKLGFSGTSVCCVSCAKGPFIQFTTATSFLSTGDRDVDTHGHFTDWKLKDDYYEALRLSYSICYSQDDIFKRDVGTRYDPTKAYKPGLRLKLRIDGVWRSAVIGDDGLARTKSGPVVVACPARPLGMDPFFTKKDFYRLSNATYIQGPPGTGKTTFAVNIIKDNLAKRVTYCAPSNASVRATVDKLSALGIRVEWVKPKLSAYEYPDDVLVASSSLKVSTTGCVGEACQVLIIDEVSLLAPSEVVQIASYGVEVYCIGDHLQLSPVTNPPTIWGNDFWLLKQVSRHEILSQCYRFGPDVVSSIRHIYPTLLPAEHHTTLNCKLISKIPKTLDGQVICMYNHDLPRFPGAITVDSAQGSTFDHVVLIITAANTFTVREARVNVAITRGRYSTTIYAPAMWYTMMSDSQIDLSSLIPQSDANTKTETLVFCDFEFAHTKTEGELKHRNVIIEAGCYNPQTSSSYSAYIPPRHPKTGDRPQKIIIPSVCKHVRGHTSDNSYYPTRSEMLKFLGGADTVVVYNGHNDVSALEDLKPLWAPQYGLCSCGFRSTVFGRRQGANVSLCKSCYIRKGYNACPRFICLYIEFKFLSISGMKLEVEHAKLCGFSHGPPHHALSDAIMTACVHGCREGLGRLTPKPPKGDAVIVLASGPWNMGGVVLVDGKTRLPDVLPISPHSHTAASMSPTSSNVFLCPVASTGTVCGSCAQLERKSRGFSTRNPGFGLKPLRTLQVSSGDLITGFVVEDGKQLVVLSRSPYKFPYMGSVGATMKALSDVYLKPLPVESVVKGLNLWGCNVFHSSLPTVPVDAIGVLTTNPDAKNGIVVSWSKLSEMSVPATGARFEVAGVPAGSSSYDEVPYWLTSRSNGSDIPLPETKFSIGSLCGLVTYPEYIDTDPPDSMSHIFSGEGREHSTKVDGVHHVSGPVQLASIHSSLYHIIGDALLLGSVKARTTLIDLSRNDFVDFIKSAEGKMTTQSKVVTCYIDYWPVSVMVWRGKTAYPVKVEEQVCEIAPSLIGRSRPTDHHVPSDCDWYALGVDFGRAMACYIPKPKKMALFVDFLDLPVAFSDPFLSEVCGVVNQEYQHLIVSQCLNPDVSTLVPGGSLLIRTSGEDDVSEYTRFFGRWTRLFSRVEGTTTTVWFLFTGKLLAPVEFRTDSHHVLNACYPWRHSDSSLALMAKRQAFRCVPVVPLQAVAYDHDRVSTLCASGSIYLSPMLQEPVPQASMSSLLPGNSGGYLPSTLRFKPLVLLCLLMFCVLSCCYVCKPPFNLDCTGVRVSVGGPVCSCVAPLYPTPDHRCPSGMRVKCSGFSVTPRSSPWGYYGAGATSKNQLSCWCLRDFQPVPPSNVPEPPAFPTDIPPTVLPLPTRPPKPEYKFPTETLLLNDSTFFSSNIGVAIGDSEISVTDWRCAEGFGYPPLCLKTDRIHRPYGSANCPPVKLSCPLAYQLSKLSKAKARGWFDSDSPCMDGTMRKNARGYSQNCQNISLTTCKNSMDTGSDSTFPTSSPLWTFCRSDLPPIPERRVVATITNGTVTSIKAKNPNTVSLIEKFFGKVQSDKHPSVDTLSFADVMSISEIEHALLGDVHPDVTDFRSGSLISELVKVTEVFPQPEPPMESGTNLLEKYQPVVELGSPIFIERSLIPFYSLLQQLEMPTFPEVKINPLFQLPSQGLFIEHKIKRSNVTFAPSSVRAKRFMLSLGYVNSDMCPFQLVDDRSSQAPVSNLLCVTVPPNYFTRVVAVRQAFQKGQQGVQGCTATTFPPVMLSRREVPYGSGTMKKFASAQSDIIMFLGKQSQLEKCTGALKLVTTLLTSKSTNSKLVERYCDPKRAGWPVFAFFYTFDDFKQQEGNLNRPQGEGAFPYYTWSSGPAPKFNFSMTWVRLQVQRNGLHQIKFGQQCVLVSKPTYWFVSQSKCISAPPKSRCLTGPVYSDGRLTNFPTLTLPCGQYSQGVYYQAGLPTQPVSSVITKCDSLPTMTSATVERLAPGAVLLKGEIVKCYNLSLLMQGVCVNNTAATLQLVQLLVQLYPPLTNYSNSVTLIQKSTSDLSATREIFLKQTETLQSDITKALFNLTDTRNRFQEYHELLLKRFGLESARLNRESAALLAKLQDIFSKAVNATQFEPIIKEGEDLVPVELIQLHGYENFLVALVLGIQLSLILLCSLPGLVVYRDFYHLHQD
ncbi:1b protein [Wuhan japanese halfbeak arterivirus]|uniref:Replicase polyprotein 1ab n=1 Tax=Wuhan japanese halfbeak arterivirus TaxID=2116443 RepID=A0A2P1GMU2_9NIDO|nr:1b protein [Wuhan japanese halfbeak arterivirus]AVM87311.1 1b protein [Wuhan japanese halfbeak arterivirus]